MSAQEETLLPLVLKVDFLLFLDLSFLKRVHRASPVIDIRKTASSRRVIECLKQKPWSLTGAHNLSRRMYWNVAHSWHMETLAGLVSYILNIQFLQMHSHLSLVALLFYIQWWNWKGICLSLCVCVCAYTGVCICVNVREEKERRSKPKCNLSLNHIASLGEKPLFLGLVSELNHDEGPIFQK